MKKSYPVEFVFQMLSLLVALIVVHALYDFVAFRVLLRRPATE